MGNWPVGVFVVVLVAGILAFNGAIWVVVLVFVRRRIRRIHAQWVAQGLIIRKGPQTANYIGHERAAHSVDGSCVLALTDHDLRVLRIVPRHEYVIPLAQITHVEQLRAWKNKYRAGSPVVLVHYHDTDAALDDAIGFSLRSAPVWLDAINAAINDT
jgi:hypothetical protein